MSVALVLTGCLFIAYGIMLKRRRSGTFFYTVWCALGTCLLVAAGAVHAGIWETLPAALKLVIAIVLVTLFCVLVFVNALIFSQFGASGEPDLDYLIVLGAQIYSGGRPSPVLRYRLDAASTYLHDNPRTLCIVSGGQGRDEPFPEAQGMAAYLVSQGISPSRIMQESSSTNTVQNMSYSFKLIGSMSPRVGIVTNNFHVFRAMRLARRIGAQHISGIAAYSTLWNLPNNLLRESFAIIKNFMVGNL
ncbi:MAG: YdcF family protein [Coriobacteriales bacterium]|jgi:uncharacterized SAM-binding protein YcdF (DUF218 family)|nr:YdcF family protein [Coriobacteriales bacterium]